MNRNRSLKGLWVVPLVGFLVLAALPVEAQRIGTEPPAASMSVHGGNVSFTPRVNGGKMTLTVVGQGHMTRQVVGSGQTASFAPVDSEGVQLPDGTYKWEVVIAPRPQDLNPRAFRNGKTSADGRKFEAAQAPRGQRQSGVFTIKNGVMVDSSLVEPAGVRAAGATTPRAATPPSAAARAAEHNDRDN